MMIFSEYSILTSIFGQQSKKIGKIINKIFMVDLISLGMV